MPPLNPSATASVLRLETVRVPLPAVAENDPEPVAPLLEKRHDCLPKIVRVETIDASATQTQSCSQNVPNPGPGKTKRVYAFRRKPFVLQGAEERTRTSTPFTGTRS